jgi:hypothetical protein
VINDRLARRSYNRLGAIGNPTNKLCTITSRLFLALLQCQVVKELLTHVKDDNRKHLSTALISPTYINSVSEDIIPSNVRPYLNSISEDNIPSNVQPYLNSISEDNIPSNVQHYLDSVSEDIIPSNVKLYLDSVSEDIIPSNAHPYLNTVSEDIIP